MEKVSLYMIESESVRSDLKIWNVLLIFFIDMAPVGRAAVAPPQMRPPMMAGPPTGMMQGTKKCLFTPFSIQKLNTHSKMMINMSENNFRNAANGKRCSTTNEAADDASTSARRWKRWSILI